MPTTRMLLSKDGTTYTLKQGSRLIGRGIRNPERFLKARARRPKHEANDYWRRTANTPALPTPISKPVISPAVSKPSLGAKCVWHPTKGFRNRSVSA